MIKYIALLSTLLSTSAFSKDFRSKKALAVDGYLFFESATQPNMLLMVEKTETVILSQSENITTSGIPVKSFVIQTRWVNNADDRRAALAKAIAVHPEWENFAKNKEEIASSYCRFKLDDPDLKVGQGDRETSLIPVTNICDYVVHAKSAGEAKLLQAIRDNNAIDSGLGTIRVLTPSSGVIFDALQISERVKTILAKDLRKQLKEREAAFYVGASLAKYEVDEIVANPETLFEPANRKSLIAAMNETFDLLFKPVQGKSDTFVFYPISVTTPISVDRDKELIFDPQAKV